MTISANNLFTERRVRRAARSVGMILVQNPVAEGYMLVSAESGTVLDGRDFTLTLTGARNVIDSLIEEDDILDQGDAEDAEREAAMLAVAAA